MNSTPVKPIINISHCITFLITIRNAYSLIELVAKIVGKSQLTGLRSAAKDLSIEGKWLSSEDITAEMIVADEDMLKELHHFLFEIHVLEGHLVCPESGRRFPIKDGIPNMLLHEDEV